MKLSEAVGLHQSQISRICRGMTVRETERIVKICAYLKINDAQNVEGSSNQTQEAIKLAIEHICQGSIRRRKQVLELLKLVTEIRDKD